MSTQNAINFGDSARVFTGVDSWSGAGNYFDDTTLGSFTVLRAGKGYIKGKPVSWAGSQTVTGLTAGLCWYIYIDSTGTIGKSSSRDTVFDTGDYICLFECLRDNTPVTNNQVTVREDHPYNFPYGVCEYLHDSIGVIIENRAQGANITLNGTQKIQINGADILMDHGLETDIPDSGGVAVTWHKKYLDATGKWALQNASDTFSGYWNNAGTPTALTGGKFGVYTLYVSKDNKTASTPTYFSVLNSAQYNNQNDAATAIGNGSTQKATNELMELELCQLGSIIFRQSTNAIVQVIIAKTTFQSSVTTTGSNAASLINTSTANFTGILNASDTNVQVSLDALSAFQTVVNCTTSNTVTMSPNTVYIATSTNGSTKVVFTLPGTFAIGDYLVIVGASSGYWELDQNAANTIFYDNGGTTPGATGKVTVNGAHQYASIKLVAITTANWVITSVVGAITLA